MEPNNDRLYIKGFNYGCSIAKEIPEIWEILSAFKGGHTNPYALGTLAGGKQYEQEIGRTEQGKGKVLFCEMSAKMNE